MTFMRIVVVVVAIACAVFLGLCICAGVFDTVTMSAGEMGPYCLVYREHRGPYRGVKYAMFDVYKYLEKRSIVPRTGFAVFYDNPQKVMPADLKSIAGFITDTILAGVAAPYAAGTFARTRAVTAVFPLRSFMSQMTGPVKVYPKLQRFLQENKLESAGPVMEIYDIAAKKIVYIAPVKN
jgi:AraC family transcriptional regulator